MTYTAHGFTRGQTAVLMGLSHSTVKSYLGHAYRVLRARNMGDAVRRCYLWKLISPCGEACYGCKALAEHERKVLHDV